MSPFSSRIVVGIFFGLGLVVAAAGVAGSESGVVLHEAPTAATATTHNQPNR